MRINFEFHFFMWISFLILVELNHKNMDEEKFKIRSYGWTELALCYNPDLHPNSASRLLHRWVVRNEKLTRDLRAAGFCERQRKLTPKQVGVIVDFLGEP